jgi:hypothetical protein
VIGANSWGPEISKSVMAITARSHGPAYGRSHQNRTEWERAMTNTNIIDHELVDDELHVVAGGWSVDTLAATGAAASKPSTPSVENLTLSFSKLNVEY